MLILLTGTCLPSPYLERLQDMTSDVPQIRIVQKDPAPHKAMVRDILNNARQTPDQPCIQFRNDDDDAVSVDFVERLRRMADDNAGLMQRYESVGIDFNSRLSGAVRVGWGSGHRRHALAIGRRPWDVCSRRQQKNHIRPDAQPASPVHAGDQPTRCAHVGAWSERVQ